ncbi:PREDICTED: uncharacterized protein LOC101631447 isoform X2 [Condylura cristata]|uniref:uncharacterized protein LOC101631447 isoform X2 n=1 Tax=Condylura cristata TaxID=143302 RepID=UPI000642AF12|nr:PREDICTED: uncharacterized protein LOC101631447 isoform X2 [Condylura cristata]
MLTCLCPRQVRHGQEGQAYGRGRCADAGLSPTRPSEPQAARASSTPAPSNQRGPPSPGSRESCGERASGRGGGGHQGSGCPRGCFPGAATSGRWDRSPEPSPQAPGNWERREGRCQDAPPGLCPRASQWDHQARPSWAEGGLVLSRGACGQRESHRSAEEDCSERPKRLLRARPRFFGRLPSAPDCGA